MENNNRSDSGNPSQEEQPNNKPQQPGQKFEPPKEGDIRKVIRSTDKEAIDNDFTVGQEDRLKHDEAHTEEENNTSGTGRGEIFNKDSR